MSELIKHFGIDWKLLLAQAVNFLILLFILKRFAYGPILKMLKNRKETIEKGIRMKEEAEREVSRIEVMKDEVLTVARADALKIVSSAEKTGEKRKNEIMNEASKKTETIVYEAKKRIEEEKAKMRESVYKDTALLIKSALARVLKKMPADERDNLLIREALEELKRGA